MEPLKQLLIVRTEGNPFFLEEAYAPWWRRGCSSVCREPITWRRSCQAFKCRRPSRRCWRRIDRLPREKRLLQTAAVFGMEVPLALLQAIADLPEEALHRGLGQLQAAEFLYETRLFPEHAYTFKHALTHEVAYRDLLRERRRTLHARIVEALEALAGDRPADQVERLADHAVREEVWDKALVYCRQAGAKAMERSASREAVGCYEQALAALAHLPNTARCEQAIDVRCDLCIACMVLGQHERALRPPRSRNAGGSSGRSAPARTGLPPSGAILLIGWPV